MAGELEAQWLENRRQKPVKNQDLWQALEAESAKHEVEWCWVKGHSGHPENERADALANRGMQTVRDS